jgi:hypothetical protein
MVTKLVLIYKKHGSLMPKKKKRNVPGHSSDAGSRNLSGVALMYTEMHKKPHTMNDMGAVQAKRWDLNPRPPCPAAESLGREDGCSKHGTLSS